MHNAPILEADNITKKYKGRAVLRGVGYTLHPGECLGVAGHNGSGKSTLLSITAQVIRTDGGSLTSGGKSIVGDKRFMRGAVGYVPQQDALLGDLTVAATLEYWRGVYNLDRAAVKKSLPVRMMGLQELYKKRVKALSGGMKKRVSIALALLHRPALLVLDEAFSALDRRYRVAFEEYLAAYKQNGGAILYCSHELQDLLAASDRVLVLRDGERVFYDDASRFPRDAETLNLMMNSGLQ